VLSFRLKWSHKEDVYAEATLQILKAIRTECVQLERLVLIDDGIAKLPGWNPPPDFADFIVDFASKMANLSCFCITFNQIDADLMNGIKQRVDDEVVTMRCSLWFHLGRVIPKASDVGVPSIHYHQIVEPVSFVLPVDMDVTEHSGYDILVKLSRKIILTMITLFKSAIFFYFEVVLTVFFISFREELVSSGHRRYFPVFR